MTGHDDTATAIEHALHGGGPSPLDDRPRIDLNHAVSAYQHGPITVWMTWLRQIDRWEPCIVLTPQSLYASGASTVVPCVVPLGRAYAWASAMADHSHQKQLPTPILGDLRDVMETAVQFAFTLGLDGMAKRDVFRVLRAVDDHLSELISMAPRPIGLGERHVADMVVTDANSGKVWEMEVRDVV